MTTDCTEPDRASCPRMCQDFCNKEEEARASAIGLEHNYTTLKIMEKTLRDEVNSKRRDLNLIRKRLREAYKAQRSEQSTP